MLRGKALPALIATGRVMGSYGATFAAIGAAFSAVDVRSERQSLASFLIQGWKNSPLLRLTFRRVVWPQCISETTRGSKDVWNGVLGGAAAGAVLGMRGEHFSAGR